MLLLNNYPRLWRGLGMKLLGVYLERVSSHQASASAQLLFIDYDLHHSSIHNGKWETEIRRGRAYTSAYNSRKESASSARWESAVFSSISFGFTEIILYCSRNCFATQDPLRLAVNTPPLTWCRRRRRRSWSMWWLSCRWRSGWSAGPRRHMSRRPDRCSTTARSWLKCTSRRPRWCPTMDSSGLLWHSAWPATFSCCLRWPPQHRLKQMNSLNIAKAFLLLFRPVWRDPKAYDREPSTAWSCAVIWIILASGLIALNSSMFLYTVLTISDAVKVTAATKNKAENNFISNPFR